MRPNSLSFPLVSIIVVKWNSAGFIEDWLTRTVNEWGNIACIGCRIEMAVTGNLS
jgi:hypothetical protein